MSENGKSTDNTPPVLKTAAQLARSGFSAFQNLRLMLHDDGRVAAIRSDGTHQVFERLVDALRWQGEVDLQALENPHTDLPLGQPTP